MTQPLHQVASLLLRVLGSLIFIMAGINHFTQGQTVVTRLENADFGYLGTSIASPETLVWLSGLGLLMGGISFLLGWKTRAAAIGLILLLIPITITIQITEEGISGPFFKNMSILGVLIFFLLQGAGHYSLDMLLSNRKK